jgi:hypothetical protein
LRLGLCAAAAVWSGKSRVAPDAWSFVAALVEPSFGKDVLNVWQPEVHNSTSSTLVTVYRVDPKYWAKQVWLLGWWFESIIFCE